MSRHIHIDYETFSEADLKSVGAWRYAHDSSSAILCAALALDGEHPVVWYDQDHWNKVGPFMGRVPNSEEYEKYWDALEDPDVLLYAHNAQFEMAITAALMWKTWGIQPPELHRWRCTASFARRAALPAKLETLAITLGLTNLKDKRGASLIRKFSVMQPAKKPSKKNPAGLPPCRIRPEDDPAAFAEFLEYCRQDVVVEQEVAKRLAYFDEPINNSTYSLDAVINARGVPVNLDALRHAQKIVDEETEIVSAKFRELTGFEITQNARFLKWLNSFKGCSFENLQADTIEAFLDEYGDQDTDFVKALQMKQSVAYASIKKIPTMISWAGPHDNKLRGVLIHHGAGTGRWTASGPQLQNCKKATIRDSAEAYRDICKGISRDVLDTLYGPPLEVIGSCIRHFVHDVKPCPDPHCDKGYAGDCMDCPVCNGTGYVERPFLDCDYSSIEARIIAWLANEEWRLQVFRTHGKIYEMSAAQMFNIPMEKIDKKLRQKGKVAELACGYQGGVKALENMGALKMGLTTEELPAIVEAWRAASPNIVNLWSTASLAATRAILQTDRDFPIQGGKVIYFSKVLHGTHFLFAKLPSGRKIAYPQAKVEETCSYRGEDGKFRVLFSPTGQQKLTALKEDKKAWIKTSPTCGGFVGSSTVWSRNALSPGDFTNNLVQGIAADIMANGIRNAEKAGYEIATTIHDQALSYYKDGQTVEEFVQCLTDLPSWAAGLPLEAEGEKTPFYRKS